MNMKKSITLIIVLVIVSTIGFYAMAASKTVVNSDNNSNLTIRSLTSANGR